MTLHLQTLPIELLTDIFELVADDLELDDFGDLCTSFSYRGFVAELVDLKRPYRQRASECDAAGVHAALLSHKDTLLRPLY
ncbi:hypothetical protein BJX70DRAFT_369516, partial [Aspergillus crustosus]